HDRRQQFRHWLQLKNVVTEAFGLHGPLLPRRACGGEVLELVAAEQNVLDPGCLGEEEEARQVVRRADASPGAGFDAVDEAAESCRVAAYQVADELLIRRPDCATAKVVGLRDHSLNEPRRLP